MESYEYIYDGPVYTEQEEFSFFSQQISTQSNFQVAIIPPVQNVSSKKKPIKEAPLVVIHDVDTLQQISCINPSSWGICPHNSRHRMPIRSLVAHLKTCPDLPSKVKQRPPPPTENVLFVSCPFNRDHRMPSTSLSKHQRTCPNRPTTDPIVPPAALPSATLIQPPRKLPKPKPGVLVFDLETDSLTVDYPNLTREQFLQITNMTVAVGYYEEKFYCFTTAPEDLAKLEHMMDAAKQIVIQNHTFDLGVLEKYYPHRKGLISWHRKVYDFYDVCRSLFGCPFPLDSLAEFNKEIPPKLGNSEDAPKLWREGRFSELVQYCKRDVEILLAIYRKRCRLRVPVRKDTVTRKIVGVVTINLLTGVIPSSKGRIKRNKRVKNLVNSMSFPTKCKTCLHVNKIDKYPTKVMFESDEERDEDLENDLDDFFPKMPSDLLDLDDDIDDNYYDQEYM